jgi:hypothetical protein
MNYRKLQNSRLSNQILEQRYLTNKSLTEDVKFTMGADKKIIKVVDGLPSKDITPEESTEISLVKTTDDDENILAAVEKLNRKFGKK